MSKLLFVAACLLIFFGWINYTAEEPENNVAPEAQTENEQQLSTEPKAQKNDRVESESDMDIRNADKIKIGDTLLQIEIADNPLEQYQGLSGRDSLCENCGMLFVFDDSQIQNFSMRGMRFDLDFLFIRGNQVLEIREKVPAPEEGEPYLHIQSSVEADMVLEVNAGFVSINRIEIGDILSIDE